MAEIDFTVRLLSSKSRLVAMHPDTAVSELFEQLESEWDLPEFCEVRLFIGDAPLGRGDTVAESGIVSGITVHALTTGPLLNKAVAVVEQRYEELKSDPLYCQEDASHEYPRIADPDETFFRAVDVFGTYEHDLEEYHCKLLWSTMTPFLLRVRKRLLVDVLQTVGPVDRLAIVCRLIKKFAIASMQETLHETRDALGIERCNYAKGQFVGGVPPALLTLVEACGEA